MSRYALDPEEEEEQYNHDRRPSRLGTWIRRIVYAVTLLSLLGAVGFAVYLVLRDRNAAKGGVVGGTKTRAPARASDKSAVPASAYGFIIPALLALFAAIVHVRRAGLGRVSGVVSALVLGFGGVALWKATEFRQVVFQVILAAGMTVLGAQCAMHLYALHRGQRDNDDASDERSAASDTVKKPQDEGGAASGQHPRMGSGSDAESASGDFPSSRGSVSSQRSDSSVYFFDDDADSVSSAGSKKKKPEPEPESIETTPRELYAEIAGGAILKPEAERLPLDFLEGLLKRINDEESQGDVEKLTNLAWVLKGLPEKHQKLARERKKWRDTLAEVSESHPRLTKNVEDVLNAEAEFWNSKMVVDILAGLEHTDLLITQYTKRAEEIEKIEQGAKRILEANLGLQVIKWTMMFPGRPVAGA